MDTKDTSALLIATRSKLDKFVRDYDGGARALAAAVGVDESVMCHWRKGRRIPAPKYRAVLWEITGINPDGWGPVSNYGPVKYRSILTPPRKRA